MDAWVHIAQTAIIALLFVGRWLQAREGGERVTAEALEALKVSVTKDVDSLTAALDEKADCDHVSGLKRRLEHGDKQLGDLREAFARQDERLNSMHDKVERLHDRVFNGGAR